MRACEQLLKDDAWHKIAARHEARVAREIDDYLMRRSRGEKQPVGCSLAARRQDGM